MMSEPLSPQERAELNRLRAQDRAKGERRELNRRRSAAAGSNYWAGILAFIVGAVFLFWPTLVWHKPDPGGGPVDMDGASWIALGIWWGSLIAVFLLVVAIATIAGRGKDKSGR
jgi:hypothetical protein